MNTETDKDYSRGLNPAKRSFSIVWIIPIVAVLITAGMIWKSQNDAGARIYITIDDGKGIMAGKTPLMYKGIEIGIVEDVQIKENDLSKLLLTVMVRKDSSSSVTRKGNKFWKVEPKISITKISGLDALFKGAYIAIMPAENSREKLSKLPYETDFSALTSAPIDVFKPGVLVMVNTVSKGEISIDAPVLYNKQMIGTVDAKALSKDKKSINIHLRIKQKYVDLIHEKSIFYKFSAIEIKASLSGLKVEVGSLASLIAGGIGLRNTQESLDSPLIKKGVSFKLYDDESATYLAHDEITLKMDNAYNLTPEISKIYYKGVEAGIVSALDYDALKNKTSIKIKLFKKFRKIANEKAYFWIVKPSLSFDKIEGLDTVIRGNYIDFSSSDLRAKEKSIFKLHTKAPQIKGIHFKLNGSDIGSLAEGAGLFYHNIEIGLVSSYVLNKDKKTFTIDLIVLPKYRNLLNSSSMFYHKRGIEIKADLSGINVKTGSLETILRGGIGAITPNFKAKVSLKSRKKLYQSYDALNEAKYLAKDGLYLNLRAQKLGSLKKDSPVFFKQIKVGKVLSYQWDTKVQNFLMRIYIVKEYAQEVQENTLFYNASGIHVKMDLNGVQVDTQSLETIITGGLSFYTPASKEAKKARNKMQYKLYDSKELAMENFINLALICEDSSGLEIGSPLKYKNVVLGNIQSISLEGKMVHINVEVQSKYQDLIKKDTAFWLESFHIGLDGVKNASSVIKGSFIVLKPGTSDEAYEVHTLMSKAPIPHFKEEGLRVILEASRLGGLMAGRPVYYRQIKIGSVVQHTLNADATKVGIEVFIEPCFAHLVRDNSYFYNTSGIGMDLSLFGAKVKTESIESILTGGVGVLTPDDFGKESKDGKVFRLYEDFDSNALNWAPKLQSSNAMCE